MQQGRVIKYPRPIQDQITWAMFAVRIHQGIMHLPEVTHRGARPLREAAHTVAPHRGVARTVHLHEAHTAVHLREAVVILLVEVQAAEVQAAEVQVAEVRVADTVVPEEGDNEKVYCINT